MAQGMIMRRGGVASGLPEFTYTGTYSLLDDGDGNWRIKFFTSGTLTFSKNATVDAFLVGGGASGASRTSGGSEFGPGGGSGYTNTIQSIALQAGVQYTIVIGAGGASVSGDGVNGNDGGTTSAFAYNVLGGKKGRAASVAGTTYGGDGGSGGAGVAGTPGSNGGNGTGIRPGAGQGTTTREFGESVGTLYATGGQFGQITPIDGSANTGDGGSGSRGGKSGTGGSGIVVIRNHRAA